MQHAPTDGGGDGRDSRAAKEPNGLTAVSQLETRAEQVADSTHVVSFAGEIDIYAEPAFRAAVLGALDAGATTLIVDLSECGFMGSTGIHILLGANKRLNGSSRPVALVTAQRSVLRALKITGMDRVFGLYSSRVAALNGNARG